MGEVREREARGAALKEAAREPDGVEHGRADAFPREPVDLVLQEADVEAGVVRRERSVAGEREEAPYRDLRARGPSQIVLADPGERRDERRQSGAGIDERLERLGDLERSDADGADLADAVAARREPRRLEVEDDELGVLDRRPGFRLAREPDA